MKCKRVVFSLLLVFSLFIRSTTAMAAGCVATYTVETIENADHTVTKLFNFFIQAKDDYRYIVLREIDVYKIIKPCLVTQSLILEGGDEIDGVEISVDRDVEFGELLIPVFKQKAQARRFKKKYIQHSKKKVIAQKPFKAYYLYYKIKNQTLAELTVTPREYKAGDTVWKYD